MDGIVGESRWIKLLYSDAAQVVLAQFERDIAEQRSNRSLYIRPRDGAEYRRVFGEDDFTSAHDVVLSPRSLFAFFLVFFASERKLPSRGWNIREVARLDLRSGEVTTALDMKLYRERNDDGWVSGLIDVDDDGTTILCKTAAHREPKPSEGPRYGKIDYSLSRVTLATGEVERITLLRNTGF
ncbi:MAG: hypothetical protein KF764_15820 [Labilithrix sp.]|nr:hypothetical protein [Labilithrix sp.]MBX3224460.1 hypothetical protein [Labilithrix sp.]